jgi:hypothetical protein
MSSFVTIGKTPKSSSSSRWRHLFVSLVLVRTHVTIISSHIVFDYRWLQERKADGRMKCQDIKLGSTRLFYASLWFFLLKPPRAYNIREEKQQWLCSRQMTPRPRRLLERQRASEAAGWPYEHSNWVALHLCRVASAFTILRATFFSWAAVKRIRNIEVVIKTRWSRC